MEKASGSHARLHSLNVGLLLLLVCLGTVLLYAWKSADVTALVLGVAGLLLGLLMMLGRQQLDVRVARLFASGLMTAALAAVILTAIALFLIPPSVSSIDVSHMIRSIHAEAEAVKAKDIRIIEEIFADDATIRDAATGEEWTSPVIRYQSLFGNATFPDAGHFEVQPKPAGRRTLRFTSGSRGRYYTSQDPANVHHYYKPPGSDEWVFEKRFIGPWVITGFTFNAKWSSASQGG